MLVPGGRSGPESGRLLERCLEGQCSRWVSHSLRGGGAGGGVVSATPSCITLVTRGVCSVRPAPIVPRDLFGAAIGDVGFRIYEAM